MRQGIGARKSGEIGLRRALGAKRGAIRQVQRHRAQLGLVGKVLTYRLQHQREWCRQGRARIGTQGAQFLAPQHCARRHRHAGGGQPRLDGADRQCTRRIRLQLVVGRRHILAQPVFYGPVPRQQNTQAIADHFAFRRVLAGGHLRAHRLGTGRVGESLAQIYGAQ